MGGFNFLDASIQLVALLIIVLIIAVIVILIRSRKK